MTPRNTTGKNILQALADGPMRADDICLAVGCSWLGVSSALRALVRDGTVKRKMGTPDVYRLTR